MAINKNFVIRNGLEVATNLFVANDVTNKIGIGTTNPLYQLDVKGDVGAYRFYGDQVRYPEWQFFGNLDGTARRALNVENADFATTSGTADNSDKILVTDTNVDQLHYIHFNNSISGYDDVNISSTRLVFNPSSGNLGVNASNPLTNLQVNFYGVESKTGTFSVSNGVTTIDTFSVSSSNFKTAEYTILIENGTNLQTQKVLVMQNGTTSHYQEYSIMYDPTPIVSIASTIISDDCVLQVSPFSGITGDIIYKFVRQTML